MKNLETKEENLPIKSEFATILEADLFLTANKPNKASFKKAVYETPNLLEVTKRDGMKLTPPQQAMLLNILVKNQDVFKGGRGYYNGKLVGIKLKDNTIPYWAKPYPIPLKNREVPEHKVARQCLVGCLGPLTPEEFEKREQAFPAFGVPKKNDTIRFVIDFRQINANLLRREFPLWTTEEILTSIKGFLYATSIDLNMGYLLIPLNDEARKILTIVMPFGAYKCLTLPIGVMPALDLFQARMVHIFAGMDERRPFPYIDDILNFKGDTFEQHLSILEEILGLIGKNGLQISAEKSHFCQESVEYLGFQLIWTGYEPLPSRVSAILCINPPKDVRGVRGFLGVLNFIKNHIPRRAKICEPITRLTKKDVKFVWGEEQQQAFDKLKAVVSEAILLTYPNPNCPFDIYPNASSTYAMGAVLAQDGKIISTFSHKFNNAQLKYTVTGQELLAAVEACKHFEQIIWGCKIRIHTDHQNLTHDGTVHINLRQQRAQILLDLEFGATFVHIKGTDNTAADGLSRLEMSGDKPMEIANNFFAILQNNLDREESNDFPLDMKRIMIAQRSNDEIQRRINSGKLSVKIGTKIIDGGEVMTINGLI